MVTSPPVPMPPRCSYLSIRTVSAPLLAAATAAPIPPGPPPTTTTSAVRQTRVSRAASLIVLPDILGDSFDPAEAGRAMPPAPIARIAAPFIAVLLTNYRRGKAL